MTAFVQLPVASLRATDTLVRAAVPQFTPLQRYALASRIRQLARDGAIPPRHLRALLRSSHEHPDARVARLGAALRRSAAAGLPHHVAIPTHAATGFDPRFDPPSVRRPLAVMAKTLCRRGCLDLDLARLGGVSGADLHEAIAYAFRRDQVEQAHRLLAAADWRTDAVFSKSLDWSITSSAAWSGGDSERDDAAEGGPLGIVMCPESGSLGATLAHIDLSQPWARALSGAISRFAVPFFHISAPHSFLADVGWGGLLSETVEAFAGSCTVADDGSIDLGPDLIEQLRIEFDFDEEDLEGDVGDRVRDQIRFIRSVDATSARFASDRQAITALHRAAADVDDLTRPILRAVALMLRAFVSLRDRLTGGFQFTCEPLSEESCLSGIHLFTSTAYAFQTSILDELHSDLMQVGADAGVVVHSENTAALAGLASLQGGCITALSAVLSGLRGTP